MKQMLTNRKILLITTLTAITYIALTSWLMNIRLVGYTLSSSYTITAKLQILSSLFYGMFTSMPMANVALLVLAGILTGANIALAFEKISLLRKMGKLQLSLGGGFALGIVSSGCASCGLPVLSLFGLGGSIVYLPYHGNELSVIAVILLLASFIYLLYSVNQVSCEVPLKVDEGK